ILVSSPAIASYAQRCSKVFGPQSLLCGGELEAYHKEAPSQICPLLACQACARIAQLPAPLHPDRPPPRGPDLLTVILKCQVRESPTAQSPERGSRGNQS